MDAAIAFFSELGIRPGQMPGFLALRSALVADARANEPGTLDYEWSASPDGTSCHLYERYADSAAVLAHLATFQAKFAAQFFAVLEPRAFWVYGSPSDALRAQLAAAKPQYMEAPVGFRR